MTNENKEFEFINKKTSERAVCAEETLNNAEKTYRDFKAKRRNKAIVMMVVAALVAAALEIGIFALANIEWINTTFRTVLLCAVGAWMAFKAGYYWHEIKK